MLKITFINVGYGDSILIEELNDSKPIFSMLIDGGVPYMGTYCDSYDCSPGRIPPFKYLQSRRIQSLDVLFLSHLHIDHVGGMPEVMQTCKFGYIWSSCKLNELDYLDNLNRAHIDNRIAKEMRTSLNLLADMQRIANINGKEIEVVGKRLATVELTDKLQANIFEVDPFLVSRTEKMVNNLLNGTDQKAEKILMELDEIENNSSVALQLKYGDVKILLPADLPSSFWRRYNKEPYSLKADILKIPHHGQADSMTKRLAGAINPTHAIVSVSRDNPFGAPVPEVLSMFDSKTNFWVTDNIEMPPYFRQTGPHRAVLFEIQEDGSICAMNEPA